MVNFFVLQLENSIKNSLNKNKKLELETDKYALTNMKTVACRIVNPMRTPIKGDQYDSFRSEGRVPLNIGFGLALMGFEVNIIFNEWEIEGRKEVSPNVYLSNLPIHRHYNYVLTWTLSGLDQITFDNLVFMDWNFTYVDQVYDFIKTTNSNVIYTGVSNHILRYARTLPVMDKYKFEYLPGLYPIPSINVGFLPYKFENKNELKIYSCYNESKGAGITLKKQQLVIDFLKNKGYNIKLVIHTASRSTTNPFNIDNKNVEFIYDTEARYIDIVNTILSSDMCILIGSRQAASCLGEVISSGKPFIFISDSTVDIKKDIFTNYLCEYSEYFLYIHESEEESLKKLEEFITNPEISYNKFKESCKDLDFNNWKEIAKKYFV